MNYPFGIYDEVKGKKKLIAWIDFKGYYHVKEKDRLRAVKIIIMMAENLKTRRELLSKDKESFN